MDVQDLLRVPDLDTADVTRDRTAADLPGRLDRTRRRRATVAFGGAAALVAAGGLAAAAASGFFDGPRPEVAGVQCVNGSSSTILDAMGSGSPIDACVTEWRSTGEQVPSDLVMASIPGQAVMVVPRAELPSGASVLDAPPAIDTRMAELSDALTDQIRGVDLGRTCRTADDVQRRIDEITGELGLRDTPVTRRSEGGSCAFAYLDTDGHGIVMFLRPPPGQAGPASSYRRWDLFVGDLAALTNKPGASVAELKTGVEAAVTRRLDVGGFGQGPVRISVIPTKVGTVPRLYLRSSGDVQIYAPE